MSGAYKPPQERELRAQGRRTRARLSDAGLAVFAQRGFHAARVDDIVRQARTSHGTFYLYFANKEDLLRSLAIDCAQAYEELASRIAAAADLDEIEAATVAFFEIYQRYGPVIRAWMEHAVPDREVNRLGIEAFRHIAEALGDRLGAAGRPNDSATVGTLMALLERSAYYAVSGAAIPIDARTVATIVRFGWFGTFAPDSDRAVAKSPGRIAQSRGRNAEVS